MGVYKKIESPHFFNIVTNLFSLCGRGKRVHKVLGKIFDQECKDRVLELGSGTSQFYFHYLRNVCSYIVSDINLEYLRFSKRKTEMKNIPHIVFDAQNIPFQDNSIDRVFALFLFHHLCDEAAINAFNECRRIVRKGGKIIIADPFLPEKNYDFIAKFLAKIDRGRWIRDKDKFYSMLGLENFDVSEHYLEGSYPYNIYIFIVNN